MSSKRPVAPPPVIPGFTYISLLGSGGFSDVYLYEQDRPRRKVAVKVLLSDLKTEGARRRFESEANLMAQLSSHPYIVTIFEAEITDSGHSYLAMEYCSRPSLDVRYRRQRFSVDEVLAVGIQVASAVETAHRAGIAHRDIKPANILVTDYNRPALTDFGISGTLAGDADEDAGMSIPWSPPEQFTGHQVDGVLVDVWALGATLYTLLAGRSPFVLPGADNSQRELISRITNLPVPKLGRADVPESLELALSTAMAKSASSRYSSAHAFALALQRIQAELNLSVTPFEVLEEPRAEENHPDDGFEETRVRSVAAIDPDATGSAPTFPATVPRRGHGSHGRQRHHVQQRQRLQQPATARLQQRNRPAARLCPASRAARAAGTHATRHRGRRRRPRGHGQPFQRRAAARRRRGRTGARGSSRPATAAASCCSPSSAAPSWWPPSPSGIVAGTTRPGAGAESHGPGQQAARGRPGQRHRAGRHRAGRGGRSGREGQLHLDQPAAETRRQLQMAGPHAQGRRGVPVRPPGPPLKSRRTRPNPAASRS